jgi:hypothetical protein
VEENKSQKVLQVYPGFWSCVLVGTNHPVHEVQVFARVFASSLKYQVLETSAHLGETIQAVDAALQIKKPPEPSGLEPNGAVVSKTVSIHDVKLVIVNGSPIPKN